MRGLLPGLTSPLPVGPTLPALYLQDVLAQELCAGLDEALAPILLTLDTFPAYLDPGTTPEDMLGWLAGWLGLTLDDHQSPDRKRDLVRTGIHLLRRRGTARGVREAVEAVFDQVPEVRETGGAGWSARPATPLPGSSGGELVVRLRVEDPQAFDRRRLEAVVAAVAPAHVASRVEVLAREGETPAAT